VPRVQPVVGLVGGEPDQLRVGEQGAERAGGFGGEPGRDDAPLQPAHQVLVVVKRHPRAANPVGGNRLGLSAARPYCFLTAGVDAMMVPSPSASRKKLWAIRAETAS